MAKKYIVGNPYGLRQGLPIIHRADGKVFYEGDEFKPLPKSNLKRLIDKGFLVEASNGTS